MSVITKDLGAVTAYAAAVNRGYTGSREEFETLMASYAYVGEQAAESASNASQSATNASQSATDAQTAKGTAQQAATDAQTAQALAQGYAQSAQQSAQSASQSAQDAESAKETAVEAVDGFAAGAQQALDSVNQAGNNWKSLAQAQKLDAEAWAVGTRDGEDVGSSDPAYHNNAKYYAEQGGASAQTASEAAQTATTKASEAAQSASAAAESARTLTIDATLTQAGQAADSKATGVAIAELKNDLNGITGFPLLDHTTWISGEYIMLDGSVGTSQSQTYKRTDYVEVFPDFGAVKFTSANAIGYDTQYNAWYDENHDFISSFSYQQNSSKTIVPPLNAKYFRLSCNMNVDLTYQQLYSPDIRTSLDALSNILEINTAAGRVYQSGLLAASDGTYNPSRLDYVCTVEPISISANDVIQVKNIPIFGSVGNTIYFCLYDSEKNHISNKAVLIRDNTAQFVVPLGASYVHFSITANTYSLHLNPDDYSVVRVFINGNMIGVNAIENIENQINGNNYDGFVVGADFLKRTVKTRLLGSVKYGQSFCVYNNKYYSTDGNNIGVQANDFAEISTTALAVGHGNNFQLGNSNIAYISGWSDNKVYAVDLDSLTIDSIINLDTTGYTTAVIDELNHIAYIFQRDSYPDTVANYNFIVYDYQNEQVISQKVINAFGAMQAADYYNGKIAIVWGTGTSASPSGMAIYNTKGDMLAEYNLDIFANAEPEGVCFNRDTNEMLIGIGQKVYKITGN